MRPLASPPTLLHMGPMQPLKAEREWVRRQWVKVSLFVQSIFERSSQFYGFIVMLKLVTAMMNSYARNDRESWRGLLCCKSDWHQHRNWEGAG